MSASGFVVVKVGGSLLGWEGFPGVLRNYLDGACPERLVLVAGGGKAADLVRELDSRHGIGENRSHALALRALDLTAHLVAALVPGLGVVERPEEREAMWERGVTPVLAPRWFLENVDGASAEPLPASWDVTTDSIAARLAVSLGAEELRLLKSTGVPGALSRVVAARAGLVDRAFPAVAAPLRRVSVVNLRRTPPTVQELA